MLLGQEEIQTHEETPGVRRVHADKTRRGHSEQVAVCRAEPEASEEPGPADAGILDLSLQDFEEASFHVTAWQMDSPPPESRLGHATALANWAGWR